MRALRQRVQGDLYTKGGERALLLHENASDLYLRYALMIMGPETLVFPAFLLDDWGNEFNKLSLYGWIRENGNAFPRAELFGFYRDGTETQHFLRELELYARYPTFVYRDRNDPVSAGLPIDLIAVATPGVESLQPLESAPAATRAPLRRASVRWFRIAPNYMQNAGFSLESKSD